MIIIRCLNCGHCCIKFNVVIIKKGSIREAESIDNFIESDFKIKDTDEICEHLDYKDGKFFCTIHHHSWFKQTPCYEFIQIEESINDLCRIGEWYQLQGKECYQTIMEKWNVKD